MDIQVLIVEDDPMVSDIHRKFITAIDGFEVTDIASTGKEALDILETKKINLIILDIFMPTMDGIETMTKIRESGKDVDIILITAAMEGDTIKRCLRFGALDYILKPFKFERLCSSLENYKKMYNKRFEYSDKYAQSDIDNLLLTTRDLSGSNELPKGLQNATLEKIIEKMIELAHPLSADEVASTCGISRVTARRYLEYLLYYGKAVIEPQHMKVGRPVNKYRFLK
ncbi:MAG: response regulator [Spirochaetia bacterium]|jgi:two-component system response regulator DctR|nr:response regulator [Spirochaetia bacterium]